MEESYDHNSVTLRMFGVTKVSKLHAAFGSPPTFARMAIASWLILPIFNPTFMSLNPEDSGKKTSNLSVCT